jgi:hypothetical protein
MYDSDMTQGFRLRKAGWTFFVRMVWVLAVGGVLQSEAQATKIEAGLGYPLVAGMAGQSFNSNLGASGTLVLAPMIEPWISNWISVEYYSLTWRTDTAASFRVIPFLAGVSFPGKVTEGVTSEFGVGLGGAVGYLNAPGFTSFRTFGYFAAQFRGGMEVDLGSGFSVFARIPVTIIVGARPMTYLSFVSGAGFQF